MSQVENILAKICEAVRDPLDYLDVQAIIQAGDGKQSIGLVYEADGDNRADLIAVKIKAKLKARLHGLLRPHRILMQVSSSSAKPASLGEWAALTANLEAYCELSGRWLAAPERKDETLLGILRFSIVLWIAPPGSLN
jgi:hypothetical protein